MKRTNKKPKKSVDAIFTADWHIREDTPVCRTDDFEESQWNKIANLRTLQRLHDCPIYHAGDLFHHWKPSPSLLTKCIDRLPDQFHTVYGNHDLPQHSMDLEYKSGVRTLAQAGVVTILEEGHWDHPPEKGILFNYTDNSRNQKTRKVGIWHNMVWTNQEPFPGAEEEDEGHTLLRQFPQFDLIVTGDNHQQFICKENGRLLLNTGNLTRQTAAQKFFEPCVWLYHAKTNSVEAHYFDVDPEDITRVHIEEKEERNERINAFVERLSSEFEGSLDFVSNLRRFGKENEIKKEVMEITYKAIES